MKLREERIHALGRVIHDPFEANLLDERASLAGSTKHLRESSKYRKPLINVNEARKLLGKENIAYSDDQLNIVIHTLTLLARYTLQSTGSKNKVGINERK